MWHDTHRKAEELTGEEIKVVVAGFGEEGRHRVERGHANSTAVVAQTEDGGGTRWRLLGELRRDEGKFGGNTLGIWERRTRRRKGHGWLDL